MAPGVKPANTQDSIHARLSSHASNPSLSSMNIGPYYRSVTGSSWVSASPISESRRSSVNNHPASTRMPPPISRTTLSSGPTPSVADVPGTGVGPMGYVTLEVAENEAATTSNIPSLNYSTSSPPGPYAPVGSLNPRHSTSNFVYGFQTMPTSQHLPFNRSSSPPLETPTTLYSYSVETGPKADNADQDSNISGTLISGEKYAPLQRPSPKIGDAPHSLRGHDLDQKPQRETIGYSRGRY
ncbi:MAG: hypothetical protein M1821_001490 [Bathelium mastoideum]|nr:MAG: hypothetical protein M1821_001490 [Bathelium mastoideum]KAI9690021.1 MAG: hypothetical protein M1822_009903 [Bathelium mastoideum]